MPCDAVEVSGWSASRRVSLDPWDYYALTYTDFFSFVVGLIGRPVISRFFTPDEAFWNTPAEVPGIQSTIKIGHDKYGLPYLTASSQRPAQIELLRLVATGKSAAVLGASMTDTDMITRTVISEEALLWKLRKLPRHGVACLIAYSRGKPRLSHKLQDPRLLLSGEHYFDFLTAPCRALMRGLTRDFVRVHLKESLGDKWKLFDFGFPEGVPPLNPEGSGPSLYDLEGKPVAFPSVELKDTEWSTRGPSAFPEITEGPHSLNPEFGGPMHDRDPSPKMTPERMHQFKEDMQRAEDFYDLKHPKPWTTEQQPQHSNTFSLKVDGSNGWAVSGKLTKTGMPLLAGDPHVEVNAPGFWMPMWLKSDGKLDGLPVRGVGATAVGTTGMFIGHNDYAAWTQTVAHTDIEDLFLVELNEEGTHYYYGGKQYPLKFIEHNIYVKGRPNPIRHISRYSHHGPLFSDAVPPLRKRIGKNQALVLASVALRAPLPVAWAEKMLFGKEWKDYIEMGQHAQMNEFVCIWATKDGAIGASVTGAVPVRPFSTIPQFRDGSDPKQDWKGVLPQEQIPFVMNPKSGIIVAGNSVLADDPKRLFGEVFVPGHRVRRAHQLLADLKSKKEIEIQDLIKMQEDQYSEHGCEFKDFVLKEFLHRFDLKNDQEEATALCADEGLTPYVARLLTAAMESWDCSMNATSHGASIYEVWLQMVLQGVFAANNWSDEALFSLVESGLLPAEYPLSRLLCKSATDTVKYLMGRLGPDVKDWHWGKLRSRYIDHLFVRDAPALRHLLSVGPLKWGGNFGTLKAHHFEPHILKADDPLTGNFHRGIDTTSLRVVFDLSNWENSLWAYYPGVSGWPGSKHYGDTAELLEDGKEKLMPIPWDEEKIEASLIATKILSPKQERQQAPQRSQQPPRQQQQKQEF
ncbi:penicillin amidase domain-containing protein, putative [Eimeria tenella]|uniref:Penicillin amidase domain-containing protein, putative n=1 Tax=Eimeria tenella TaxID=5802 RepID=U6KLY6_EIMTE|nr:penicillin amidase domain-containing protein, putative [Eimeria tenella]CDJ38991.1 penicillin amidase domain-containing protein, putative [Eimeria tenella]|eukprot:XP_013229746.1 penicillin amidase domain-containing protein, putative [Eimeria tenella]